MAIVFSSPPFYTKYVQLPDPSQTPPEIAGNPWFYPYFADVLGALNGSHIVCFATAALRPNSHNHKGFISQNCLVACGFNLRALYVLSGWEGSAADAILYHDVCCSDLRIPLHKFYLADADFGACDELLIPYRGVRYHLAEWQRANLR
jgi:hypothetical protein